jgi:hypothetical protein
MIHEPKYAILPGSHNVALDGRAAVVNPLLAQADETRRRSDVG